MAQAISKIAQPTDFEAKQEAAQLYGLISQLSTHADVLSEGMHLLRAMHDRGILELLTALFERGDQVGLQLMQILGESGSANALRVLMAAAGSVGSYNAEAVTKSLKSISDGLESALAAQVPEKPLGVFDVFKLLKDPDVATAVNTAFAFLKGFGQSLSSASRAEGER